ncbi:MAG: hypothetical protein JW703_05265 [Candidatus Diapherotrites archaeon]|nr:hypothetical protein [Candidatus Diapherotrites archaeon]
MIKLKKILTDSFSLLMKKPLLFLPKLVIAFLYSIPMIFLPAITFASLDFSSPKTSLLSELVFWMIIIFCISLLDILFNSMYSFISKDYLNKKNISLIQSFKKALNKFRTVFPSIILTDLIFIVIAFIVSIPLGFFIMLNSLELIILFSLIYFVIILILFIAFYLIYPIASLESFTAINSLKQSVFLAKKNFKKISVVSLFSFGLSFLSISLPFLIELLIQSNSPIILAVIAFVLVRFLTAIIATYYYVLNPVFYLEAELK